MKVASNGGLEPGYRTTSSRAEAYGLLSVLLFLRHFIKYTHLERVPIIKLFMDSASVIQLVSDMMTWPYYYLSATMGVDWDVLQEIVKLCKSFHTPPTLNHVKGHQDNKQRYEDLTLEAQLNVDANEIAALYQYKTDESTNIVPMIQGSVVLLHLFNGTFTLRF